MYKYLSDCGYTNKNMFILKRLGTQKLPKGANVGFIKAYNKMHADYKMRIEWQIGGLKQK